MVLYEKYGIRATDSKNQNRCIGRSSGKTRSKKVHNAKYGALMIHGAGTSVLDRSRSHIAALLSVNVAS